MPHEIIVDVLTAQAKPANMQDKIGEKIRANPLVITYVLEAKEPRFQGQLKEIYNQKGASITPTPTPTTPTPTTPTPTTPTPTQTPPSGCAGDINGDGAINSADFVLFASAYNSVSGDSRYIVKADMNNNGAINSADFVLFAVKYGTSCSV
jgi:heme-binding NEAT domain protein